jgi:nitrous oxide reductase accessory protein NosL
MKKNLYIAAVALIVLAACRNQPTAEEVALTFQIETYDTLKTEAMQVHDEIMPKMGELMELRGELSANEPEFISKEAYIKEISTAAEYLKASHDAMMSWMQDYSEKFPYGDPTPETKEAMDKKLPLLEQEVKEIKDLKEQTLKAIEMAQELLRK